MGGGGIGDRASKEPKSAAEGYRETYRTLFCFSNVGDVAELPPVWRHLANCLKSEQHTVLTQELQKQGMHVTRPFDGILRTSGDYLTQADGSRLLACRLWTGRFDTWLPAFPGFPRLPRQPLSGAGRGGRWKSTGTGQTERHFIGLPVHLREGEGEVPKGRV